MEEELKTNPQYTPVICPRCGSQRVEFISEYHKCIVAKVINFFLLVGLGFVIYLEIEQRILTNENNNGYLIALAILLFAVFIIQLYIYFTESKTHVQGICRDCGNIWLLD